MLNCNFYLAFSQLSSALIIHRGETILTEKKIQTNADVEILDMNFPTVQPEKLAKMNTRNSKNSQKLILTTNSTSESVKSLSADISGDGSGDGDSEETEAMEIKG